jgi:hypothetical protein
MWIVKSIGLGLLAVIAALFIFVVFVIVALMILASRMAGEGGIGWDSVSLVCQQPLISVVIFLIFAVGFGIGYRHFSPRVPQ